MGAINKPTARQKRIKAATKLRNQLSVLSHAGTKADKKLVKQLTELANGLSV